MNDAVKGRRFKRSVEPEGISEIKAPDASFRADKCKDGNGIEVRLMGVPKAAVQELAPNTRAILEVTRSETSSAEILDLGRVAAFTGEGSGKLRSFPSATGIRARLLFADAETSKIVRYLDGLRIAGPNDNDSGEGDSGAEFPLEFGRSTLEGEP